MKKHLLLHNFSNIANNTGLPNFYRIVALYSQANLNTKIYTYEDIKKIDFSNLIIRLFPQILNHPIYGIISNFIYIFINRGNFDSFVLLTKSGIYTSLICRLFSFNTKISVVLYEIPVEIKYKDSGLLKKPKLKIKYYLFNFALSKYIKILFICPGHANQFLNYYPKIKSYYFNYGIDSKFYLSYVRENNNYNKKNSNYLKKPYILFVGGAYRNNNLIDQTHNYLEKYHKDFIVISTSFDPSFKNKTKLKISSNYYRYLNFDYSNYLQLVLSSSLVVISLSRSESMAGLTSFLEISTLSRKLLINETIYTSHYFELLDEKIKKNINITSKNNMFFELKNIISSLDLKNSNVDNKSYSSLLSIEKTSIDLMKLLDQ